VITLAVPGGTDSSYSYATLKGTNFSTGGDNLVTSSDCAGLQKVYDGADGAGQAGITQVNVRVPLRTSAFTCTFQVQRPDGTSPSAPAAVSMPFAPPPTPAAAITNAFPSGYDANFSYAALKGTNFSQGGDNIVTSTDCAGLQKIYDGVDGAGQPGIRQINVAVPVRNAAFSCTFQVARPDGSGPGNAVTVAMDFAAPPPPPPPAQVPTIASASSPGADGSTGDVYIVIYGSNFGSGAPFASKSSDGDSVTVTCDQGTYTGMFGDTYDGAGVSSGEEQINTTVPPGAAGNTNCKVTVSYGGLTSAPSAPFNL